jgi:hypothetical protein
MVSSYYSWDNKTVSRYQRGNLKPYIKEQTIQRSKEKGQKTNDLKNITQKTKDRATRT